MAKVQVQILIKRNIHDVVADPQEALRKLNDQKVLTGAAGFHKLVVEGVTRQENPFPPQFQQAMENEGFEYDDINFTLVRSFDRWAEGKAMMAWFDSGVRPWVASVFSKQFADALEIRVMDAHRELDAEDLEHY